jgi:phosphatidylinositol-3,4,5-trisphosphate 3-phosphatase/dual-specificity protein phosphatase PTEN
LRLFGVKRTSNGKGVTIPSQMRWVMYYEQILRRGWTLPPQLELATRTYHITHVRLITVPNFDVEGGCDPYFVVDATTTGGLLNSRIYDYRTHVKKLQHYKPKHRQVLLDVSSHQLLVRGNVRVAFFDADVSHTDDKMCHFWFHTAFVDANYLLFERVVIDKAVKVRNGLPALRGGVSLVWLCSLPRVLAPRRIVSMHNAPTAYTPAASSIDNNDGCRTAPGRTLTPRLWLSCSSVQ